MTATGWGQGVCVGDYDNDGWEDLYVTYYGKNRLYHNQNGVFTEVAEGLESPAQEKPGVRDAPSSTTTATAFSI